MIRYGIPPGLTDPEETKNWRGDDVPDPREIGNLSPEKAARPVLSGARRRTTVVGSRRDVSRGERLGRRRQAWPQTANTGREQDARDDRSGGLRRPRSVGTAGRLPGAPGRSGPGRP